MDKAVQRATNQRKESHIPRVPVDPQVSPRLVTTLEALPDVSESSKVGDQGNKIDPAPPEGPNNQHLPKLTREQSFVWVASENQQVDTEPFQAWRVETGQWGGRVIGAPESIVPPLDSVPGSTSTTIPEVKLQDWVSISDTSPFSVHPPASILRSIHESLT